MTLETKTHEDLVARLTSQPIYIASDGVYDFKNLMWIPTRIIGGYVVDAMYRVYHGTEMVYESVSWSRALEQYNKVELTDETA